MVRSFLIGLDALRCFIGVTCSVILVIGVLIPGACSGGQDGDASDSRTHEVTSPATSNDRNFSDAANIDWEVLTSGVSRTWNEADESAFSLLVKAAELSNQRRRSLGLKFWNDYPNDPRRYEWLLLAVHLSPYYPVSLNEWARREAIVGVNTAPQIEAKITEWDENYVRLRDEFLASDTVTEEQRRYLWLGEIRQHIEQAERSNAIQFPSDPSSLVDKIIAYAEHYPAPLSEIDSHYFRGSWRAIIEIVLDGGLSLDLNETQIRAFSERLEAVSTDLLVLLKEVVASREGVKDANLVGKIGPKREESAWSRLPDVRWGPLPNGGAGRVVWSYDRVIRIAKTREWGSRLWDEYPDHEERFSWLAGVPHAGSNSFSMTGGALGYGGPIYFSPFLVGVRAFPSGEDAWRHADTAMESSWVLEWDRFYAELQKDPKTSKDQRAMLLSRTILQRLLFSERREAWRNGEEKASLEQLLNDIHVLWTEYKFRGSGIADPGYFVSHLTRAHSDWGMNSDDLALFLQPMLGYEHPAMREVAVDWLRSHNLRRTPLELSAPTLSGEPFELSSLRGNIVLLEYWTTSCAVCISAMPLIHEVYMQYKDRGFEVVSVNFDADTNGRRVERIEKELNLTWPTLNAQSRWEEVKERFGLSNMLPVYMLLDREGVLVADTNDIDYGNNLRTILDQMLATEAEEKKTISVH